MKMVSLVSSKAGKGGGGQEESRKTSQLGGNSIQTNNQNETFFSCIKTIICRITFIHTNKIGKFEDFVLARGIHKFTCFFKLI